MLSWGAIFHIENNNFSEIFSLKFSIINASFVLNSKIASSFNCSGNISKHLVLVFKISKKYRGTGYRVFKMTPIHHHFEMSNWAETTIIVRFWIINGIVIVIGLGLFYGDWVLFGN